MCNPMSPKTSPLALVIFTLVSALPAGVPAAIAQEDTSLGEDLVGGIISNVLDGDADDAEIDQDSTDTTTTVSSNQEDQTVDHDTVKFGDNSADLDDTNVNVPMNVEEGPSTPPPDDRLQPEEVAFCFEPNLPRGFFCFDSLEKCEIAEELLGSINSGCERFETPPPGALSCSALEGGQNIRCELRSL
jgi:hypothetical protein